MTGNEVTQIIDNLADKLGVGAKAICDELNYDRALGKRIRWLEEKP